MDTSDLIILVVFLLIGVFLLAGSIVLAYHYYTNKKSDLEERERLITADSNRSDQPAQFHATQESSFICLADLVRIEREKTLLNTQQSAFLYLQFYIRSNTSLNFKTVEQLPLIGNHKKRTWFLTSDTLKTKKLILVDSLLDTESKKQADFSDLIGSTRMVNDIFVSLKHENVLGFSRFEVDTDKGRVLAIEDYSDEGSLRDLIQNTKPNYDYYSKIQQQVASPLCNKLIGYYGRQILLALAYLKRNSVGPVWRLHAGNVIMWKKKQLCKVTGFEEVLMGVGDGGDGVMMRDKGYEKIRKCYFVEAEDDEMKLKKCSSDFELKRVLEVFRFGWLVIEMFTGMVENKKLLPDASVLKAIQNFSDSKSSNDMIELLEFIFYNKQNLNENNPKLAHCFVLPSLEELLRHPFFASSKQIDENSTDLSDTEQLEFLNYLNRRTPRASVKPSRKFSTVKNADKKNRKSVSSESVAETRASSYVASPVPAPPLPPVQARPTIPVPPPLQNQAISTVPVPPPLPAQSRPNVDRTGLLGDIRMGAKLKKTVTNDRSKPLV